MGVSEHLGSDTFVHIETEGGSGLMTVRVDGEFDVHHGDKVFLTPDEDKIHRFDDKGERL